MNVYLDAGHQVSFGTFPLRGDDLKSAMRLAADIGYRSFDTAQMYGNERDVGDCLRTLGLPRGQLFVTTKINPRKFCPRRFPALGRTVASRSADGPGRYAVVALA